MERPPDRGSHYSSFGPEVASDLSWETRDPKLWDPEFNWTIDFLNGMGIRDFFLAGLSAFRKLPELNSDQIERLRYATSDLESGLARIPDLNLERLRTAARGKPPFDLKPLQTRLTDLNVGYRAMLARCYFAIGEYHG
jgi:hypothetical protein